MISKLKLVLVGIIGIFLITVILLAYFVTAEIETKIPNEAEYSCNIDKEKYNERRVFIITPKKLEKSDKVILYFHGGAYMAEATRDHWNFIEKIVNDTDATVIFPDYPLTPKYDYKSVFDMVFPLYKEIIQKVNPENIIMMGDSAGGGLSLALNEKLIAENITVPTKTILISPWLDVRMTNSKIDDVQKYDKSLNKEGLKLAGLAYAGDDGINTYLVNPIEGDLAKIKNITIFTSTYDILNPDVAILKERAKEQGNEIDVREYEGKEHDWIIKKIDDDAYSDLLEVIKN